jgi:hypothetical protein
MGLKGIGRKKSLKIMKYEQHQKSRLRPKLS